VSTEHPYLSALQALAGANVRFVVVGGVAAVLHGVERLTFDLDVVVELTFSPALATVEALLALGYLARIPVDPRGFADPETRASWINDKGLQVLSFWDPTNQRAQVDVFVSYPLDFEALWSNAEHTRLGDCELRFASARDLAQMKLTAGRPKDLADIRALGFDPTTMAKTDG
jgi:hypothetical protein